MNLFLNERCIRLSEHKPSAEKKHSLVAAFESKRQIAGLYRQFENDAGIPELLIWSGNEYDKLCRKFISLFTRIDAAGGLVVNEEGSLLFIYRFEYWDLPKGKIETRKNETAPDAAIREVKEETGLRSVIITGALPATWHIYRHKEKTILKCTHWFKMQADSSQILQPQEEEGILSIKWIRRQDLATILPETYTSLRELIQSGDQH